MNLPDFYYQHLDNVADSANSSTESSDSAIPAAADSTITTNSEGTLLSENTEPIADTTIPSVTSSSSVGNFSMPSCTWTTESQLSKPIIFVSGVIATTNPPGTNIILETIDDPPLARSLHNAEMDHFAYYRGDYSFDFQLNTNDFVCGLAIMFYVPPGYSRGILASNILLFPHLLVPLNCSKRFTLTIPFSTIAHYVPTFSQGRYTIPSLGYIGVQILSQMRTGSGASNSIPYTMWRSIKNYNGQIPVPSKAIFKKTNYGISNPCFLVPAHYSEETPHAQMERAVESLINNVTGLNSAGMGKAAVSLGKMALMDKPSDPRPTTRMYMRTPLRSNAEGGDTSIRLALEPASHSPAQSSSTTWDARDMSLHSLKKYKTFLPDTNMAGAIQIQWRTSFPTATLLFRCAVHPLMGTRVLTTAAADRHVCQPSMLGFISTPFCYWRGSIDFTLRAVRSKYHTGKLLVLFVPLGTVVSNTDLTTIGSTYPCYAIDIGQVEETSFSCPYMSPTPFLRVPTLDQMTDNFTSSNLSADVTQMELVILILNALNNPTNVTSTIDILLTHSGGDDFELAGPRNVPKFVFPFVVPTYSTETPHAQVGKLDASTRTMSHSIDSTTVLCTYDVLKGIGRKMYGEDCMDLRVLLKRYSKFISLFKDTSGLSFPVTPLPNFTTHLVNVDLEVETTLLGWFSSIFCFWHGSMRYMIYMGRKEAAQKSNVLVAHSPSTFSDAETVASDVRQYDIRFTDNNTAYPSERYAGLLGADIVSSSSDAIVVEIPYRSIYTCLMSQAHEDVAGVQQRYFSPWNSNGICTIISDEGVVGSKTVTPITQNFTVSQSIGDDFTMGVVLPPPSFIFQATTSLPFSSVLATPAPT